MIKARNVYKTFRPPKRTEVKALVDFSTDIKKGEVVVIIGPSGSGKSTFLRCLNRLEEIDSGEIIIDGVNIYDKKVSINKIREEIGMVFQLFNLFPHKTVLENVTLAQQVVRKRDKEKAIELPGTFSTRWESWKKRAPIRLSSQAGSNSGWPLPVPLPCTLRL